MNKIKLAVLPGDGIGREVIAAAIPLFSAMQLPFELQQADIGWDCWLREATPIPQKTWDIIHSSDAILLGATTSKPEKEAMSELSAELRSKAPCYVSPIVQLRQNLDLFANVRPCFNIKNTDKPFHFVVIRENTEGLYAGLDYYPVPHDLIKVINQHSRWQKAKEEEIACTLRIQSAAGLQRIFDYAFKYADRKKLNRVTFADKPNVLRKSSAFARDIFEKVAAQFPHITSDIHNVDAVALWMVKRPEEFGVIVAENMFGDILSDLGAGIMGGLGFAPSANIGMTGNYFEPVHGSAPRVKSNTANPAAMFLTIGLLLEHFNFIEAAKRITQAVNKVIAQHKSLTYDLGGSASTQEMAAAIINESLT